MPVYQRRTRVAAPLSEVWPFHSRLGGLTAITPAWMHMRVERVVGPEGEPLTEGDELRPGTRLHISIRPFGVGPRQRWTSRIVERGESEGRAHFRDEMADGPFRRWHHTHQFFGDGDETVILDRVEYELPFGRLGAAVGPVARIGFEPMFRYRHRKTKELLE